MQKTFLMAVTMAALLTTSALAGDVAVGALNISDAWTRATPPGARAGGGFMVITNAGKEADRLIAGSSPAAGHIELHEMSVIDNIMRMRKIEDGLVIPAGGSVALKPGGYHIMFIGLSEAFQEGSTISLTLNFEKAGAVELEMPVRSIGAGAHMKMHGHDMKKDMSLMGRDQ